mmetsp:Transcript_18722/g.50764  ORF Transcript_18722/g.50764 Transcript_18722/m.50764 type:complete len:268 (-) Transcript_18722:5149-5952(-)
MRVKVGASAATGPSPCGGAHVAPWSSRPSTWKESAAEERWPWSRAQTSRSESIGDLACRAVCWRSAVRKKEGLSSSPRLSGARSSPPACSRDCHSCSALMRATACRIHAAGSSGPSHTPLHVGGTPPCASAVPSFLVAVPSSSVPRTTRPIAPSESSTVRSSRLACSSSIVTIDSTGDASAVGGGTVALRNGSRPEPTFCQSVSSGVSCAAHRSRSNLPASSAAEPSVFRLSCTCATSRCCTARSALDGSPKSVGVSCAGSALTTCR